jgi:hypothetical protein
MPQPDNPVLTDGSMSFAGVDSLIATTLQSSINDHGCPRSTLPWLINGTVRDGGISQREGWQPLFKLLDTTAQVLAGTAGYQGGYMYEPDSSGTPATGPISPTVTLTTFSGPCQVTESPGPNYNGPLGTGPNAFQPFFVPCGQVVPVVVSLQKTFAGKVGDKIIVGTTNFTVVSIVPASAGQPPTPAGSALPYLIFGVGGHIYKADITTGTITDLSSQFGLFHPQNETLFHFCQGEQFLVIQAGDFLTSATPALPLFWDGKILRRSKGITNNAVAPGTPGVNEIPAATAMDYFMGRLWYAQGRTISAGDIVRGPSGTPAFQKRDSILNVTENPLVVGGDGFTVPDNAGNIRGIKHSAQIDASLGQGRLYIGTRKAIYALQVPVTRNDWIGADNNNQPLMTEVQLANGWVSDRSIVVVNGDLFFQSLEPGIRSLVAASRFFQQWGNVAISANIERLLQNNDRGLLHFSSGILFDNRLLMTAIPRQTARGVVHSALAPLDFVPVSSFGANLNPAWEGAYGGLDIFQLFTGDFNGRDRAFAIVLSHTDQSLFLWELGSEGVLFENGENRIQWQVEFPAYTFGSETDMKRLVGSELWVDRLVGTVEFVMEYRPDGEQCWLPWHSWKACSQKDCREDTPACVLPPGYVPPVATPNASGYRNVMTLPKPPVACGQQMDRPSDLGFQFQPRLTIKGPCRVRAIYLKAIEFDRPLYSNPTC